MLLKILQRHYKYLLVFFGAVVILFRAPDLFLYPRFWAEEGSLYYLYAYEEGFFRAIFFIPESIGGYFSLIANFSAALASLVPIKHAPKVTTFIAFVFFLLPIILITNLKSPLWDSKRKQILLTIIYLFSPIHTEEATLNTINLMSHLGICALLILLSENSSKIKNLLSYLLLALAGLSGVYAVFLAPIFLLKAISKRNNYNLKLLGIITFVSLIQIAVFFKIYLDGKLAHDKLSSINIGKKIASTIIFHTIQPIFGEDNLSLPSHLLGLNEIFMGNRMFNSTCFIFLLIVGLITCITVKKEFNYTTSSWSAFITLSLLTNISAADEIGGGRYAITPGFSFTLFIFALATETQTLKNKIVNICLWCLLSCSILTGYIYQKEKQFYKNSDLAPKWTLEVEKWKLNDDYKIKTYPYPLWEFALSKKESISHLDEKLNLALDQLNLMNRQKIYKVEVDLEKIPKRRKIEIIFTKKSCTNINKFSLKLENKNKSKSISHKSNEGFCNRITLYNFARKNSTHNFKKLSLEIIANEEISRPIESIATKPIDCLW